MFASDELEEEFREVDWWSARWAVRSVLLLTAAALGVSIALDPAGGPDAAPIAWWSRVGAGALAMGVLGASYHPRFHTVRHRLVGLVVLATIVALLAAMVVADDQVRYFHYAGLVLVVLAAHTVFRLSVPAAMLASFVALGGFAAVGRMFDPTGTVASGGLVVLGIVALVGGFASVHIEWYARRGYRELRAAEEERSRSDTLLLELFPASVVERLKHDPGPIADLYAEASVLFADIVDFTSWSNEMEPEDLLRALNTVFAELDRIVEEHGLAKIKTIGDAYMAVAGVPERTEVHLERMADAAIAVRDRFVAAGAEGVVPFELRIGIACGPVVAGVIGETKYSYDLWGDVVTTASRMTSHGVPGEIQVPEDVADRLKDRFRLEKRGTIEIKGKGPMETWLLRDRRQSEDEGMPAHERVTGRDGRA